jgi:hypothetical protein
MTEAKDREGWPIRPGYYVRVEDALLDQRYHVAGYRGLVTEVREDLLYGHVLILKCDRHAVLLCMDDAGRLVAMLHQQPGDM